MAASKNLIAGSLWLSMAALAQDLGSLRTVKIPVQPDLKRFVRDQDQLIALGKALFWDMQAGSDGRTACATCHFHAGADHRAQNQLANPNGSTASVQFTANRLLTTADFPFHVLSDPDDNRSAVLRDTSAVAGSAGEFRRKFMDIVPGSAPDDGLDVNDAPAFSVDGINTRRVTSRNTPSVINSIFYVRNFWDGRASSTFTGLTPFGISDPRTNALITSGGQLSLQQVRVQNASLASQAVGPPVNNLEMSYDGRTWLKLGKKMLGLRPLASQVVARDDSVLGPFANPNGPGLTTGVTYLAMVRAAFQEEYWNSPELVDSDGHSISRSGTPQNTSEYTQPEYNFAIFWGLAIQAYEATLVSGESRFDRFSEGESAALTAVEQNGLNVFRGRGGCTNCHVGPEFSAASFTALAQRGPLQTGRNGGRDTGFFRIGVRPIAEDIGLGGNDDFGQPLSIAAAQNPGAQGLVQGLFKTPGLRNVEFTGPYFHNGGQAALRQVVDFYSRGGDFPDGGNLGPGIRRRNFSNQDSAALVAFLLALSDDRVRFERAPFDHPQLCVPDGQVQSDSVPDARFPLSAADRWVEIPPIGQSGSLVPLQTFEELLAGIGADGSRAHALTQTCTIPLQ